MEMRKVLAVIIVALLLIINFLTFHDIAEAHSVKDWLILVASLLVFFYFAREWYKKSK